MSFMCCKNLTHKVKEVGRTYADQLVQPPAQAGSPRALYTGSCPGGF